MKYFVILCGLLIGLQANSLGMVDDLARGVKSAAKYSDDAIDILKAEKISQVTYATLKLNTVDKNIQALLHLAAKEHRLKHYSDQFTYVSKYKKFKNGDKLLLKCLKTRMCDLENFSKLMTKSPLHVKVVTKYPHMTLGQVNIKVAWHAGIMGALLIVLALIARSIGTYICLFGTELNFKERLFVVVSYIPKATVQAAIGAAPLAAMKAMHMPMMIAMIGTRIARQMPMAGPITLITKNRLTRLMAGPA